MSHKLTMKPKVKQLFLSALRNEAPEKNGLYVKARGAFREIHEDDPKAPYHHCVMGVLADLAMKAGVVTEWEAFHSDTSFHRKIVEWAGLPSASLTLTDPTGYSDVAYQFNDSEKYSFEDMANMIEEQYEDPGEDYVSPFADDNL